MNKPPEHLETQMEEYKDCIGEARLRILYSENRIEQHLAAGAVTELDIEYIALHIRKVIELVALASISANKEEYQKVRAEFHKDWNPRLIFRDIERINPQFFPIPFHFESAGKMIEPNYECLDKEGAIELYSMTSEFVHSRNRYAPIPKYGRVLEKFHEELSLLRNLLRSFEVHLIPSNFLYFVSVDYDADGGVSMALGGYIDH